MLERHREDSPGEKRLVAYVVANQQLGPSTSELRRCLQAKLPEHMLPAAFVLMDALPLTPNGKVDRRALPAPELARPALEDAFVAPHTPIEEKVAEIWAEVLGVEQVGIHDNFFDLGGHSLPATQAMARIRATFQMELCLRRFFEAPTVADLAVAIAHGHVRLSAVGEMTRLVAEVEGLSEEEARQLLGTERAAADKGKRHE